MEIQGTIYSKINWKDYLLPENNPRISRFLRTNGDLVFKQILSDIKLALEQNKDEILLVVHRNSIHIVSITRKEFDQILDHALNWFLKKEDYEECAIIRDLKNRINEN